MTAPLPTDPGVAWLIECGHNPTMYYCGPGDWCGNPSHALKFPTREAAELRSMGMETLEPVRVCEHQWG